MLQIKLAMRQNKRYTKTHSQSDRKDERSVHLNEKKNACFCLCMLVRRSEIRLQTTKSISKSKNENVELPRLCRYVFCAPCAKWFTHKIGQKANENRLAQKPSRTILALPLCMSNQFKTIGWNYKCENKLIFKTLLRCECLRATIE